MPFAISARFLFATYRGSNSVGQLERYPSPERLYKALVSAAYGPFGFGAILDGSGSIVSADRLESAFQWLEQHAPDAIRLPESTPNAVTPLRYRDQGVWDSKNGISKKIAAADLSCVAYSDTESGTLIWQWRHAPNSELREVLSALCWEVPYLGEACAPVRLHAYAFDDAAYPLANSLLMEADDFSFAGMANMEEFAVPAPGHLQELRNGYAKAYPKKGSAAKGSEDEKNVLSNDLMNCVRNVGYALGHPTAAAMHGSAICPWARGILIPACVDDTERPYARNWAPKDSELVAWCVAMHRLLVRQWGYGASPVLTGRYEGIPSTLRPANNVAIQILTPDMPIADGLRGELPAFLIMLPHDIAPEDADAIERICRAVRGTRLYHRDAAQRLVLGDTREDIDLWRFWKPVERGCTRLWSPYPFCVRETRPIPDPTDARRRWGAREHVELSVGHAWRDSINEKADASRNTTDVSSVTPSSREARYWSLVDRVVASGLRVVEAQSTGRPQMERYVHKVQPGVTLMGISALIGFDPSWQTDTTIAAIGQSRHLGGGLLLPVDIPTRLLDNMGKPGWAR
ncbi:type I-U CRISPR-associated protein Csb2 [Bifidobacterium vespertilionis]|uniref:type I-G CRISPR-associated protein Csb2 n=1 Tax=Bifidobacterium vespertilionis TaxID=2562524 RepID=UPI001BDCDB6E|nr:type I-U CRISPR-associated protein Csb2 [Bifidobacterium vespertilionis]MBT1180096.1 type I-U CRISPR-associated protein Cas5/Cas6 [Bifidobacterium vespertilionis]